MGEAKVGREKNLTENRSKKPWKAPSREYHGGTTLS